MEFADGRVSAIAGGADVQPSEGVTPAPKKKPVKTTPSDPVDQGSLF
jgi:exodeoxyribonuclease VII large subunit